MKATREEVYDAIDTERTYQSCVWSGMDEQNSIADYIIYLKRYIREAECISDPSTPSNVLNTIRKVAAIAVACMERHGAPRRVA
ncbi:MAG: hypothetical protein ACE5HX_19330 [bacterium]